MESIIADIITKVPKGDRQRGREASPRFPAKRFDSVTSGLRSAIRELEREPA